MEINEENIKRMGFSPEKEGELIRALRETKTLEAKTAEKHGELEELKSRIEAANKKIRWRLRKHFNQLVMCIAGTPYALDVVPKVISKATHSNIYTEYQNAIHTAFNYVHLPYDAQLHRFYAASFFGGIFWTAFLGFSNRFKNKSSTSPALASITALTTLEILQARLPNRSFDTGDMTAYCLGIALYMAGSMYYMHSHQNKTIKVPSLNINEPQ